MKLATADDTQHRLLKALASADACEIKAE